MMNPHLASADEVLEEELAEIGKRRAFLRETRQVSETSARADGKTGKPAASQTLVGLALSGGGVRSASFCVGILQSFYRRGVLRYVDYLSAVSGGGYSAAYLTTLVKNTERPIDWTADQSRAPAEGVSATTTNGTGQEAKDSHPERLPIASGSSGTQPPLIQQLAARMPRMGRPLRFVARLAWGVITINALILSGLLMVGALVAYLMRLTDGRVTRVYLQELGFHSDMGVAYFPAFLMFLLWTIAHFSGVLFPRLKDRGRKLATPLFILTIVCLLLGTATVLGTGDLDLSVLEQNWGISRTMTDAIRTIAAVLSPLLAGVFAASFLPYLRITQLIQSGTRTDAKPYEKIIYNVVSHILIFGTPLVVFYVVAKENISGHHETRVDRTALVPPAIKNWLDFGRDVRREAHLTEFFGDSPKETFEFTVSGSDSESKQGSADGSASSTSATAPSSGPSVKFETARARVESTGDGRRPPVRMVKPESSVSASLSKTKSKSQEDTNVRENLADHIWKATTPKPGDRSWDADAHRFRPSSPEHQHPLDMLIISDDERKDRFREQWMWEGWISLLASPVTPTFHDRVADGIYTNSVREWTTDRINRHVLSNPTLFRLIDTPSTAAAGDRNGTGANGSTGQQSTAGSNGSPAGEQGSSATDKTAAAPRDEIDSLDRQRALLAKIEAMREEERDSYLNSLLRPPSTTSDSAGANKPGPQQVADSTERVQLRNDLDRLWKNDPGEYLVTLIARLRTEMAIAEGWNDQRREWAVRRGQENLTEMESRLKRWEDALARVQRNNLKLLQDQFPNATIEKPRDTVFSYVVFGADQRTRLSYALWGGVLFLVLGLVINLNSTSMHGFFREQLAEIWTPSGADERLADLKVCEKGSPYPILTAALHRFVRRTDPEEEKKSLFLFTPRFCGARWFGFVPTAKFRQGEVTIGEAMALSGAALTPAGSENLLFRAFLMITNFRMGQWVPTPALTPTDSVRASPLRLLCNRFFFPSHQRSLCFLTDGGFAENIGVAPLLQRGCRLIIAVDGSCDPDSHFLDLAKLMRVAESRYGVKFSSAQSPDEPVDLTPVRPVSGRCPAHVVVARIQYPVRRNEGRSPRAAEGYLVYIKPSFTGDESVHLTLYREDRKQFPHDSTIDQFFEPERFEAYRQLGEHIGEAVWRQLWKRPGGSGDAAPAPPDPTKDLWTWSPVQEPPVSAVEPARTSDPMSRALQKLESSIPAEREEAIAWLGEQISNVDRIASERALDALHKALQRESDDHNRRMIEKAIDHIGGSHKSVQKYFKKRLRRG